MMIVKIASFDSSEEARAKADYVVDGGATFASVMQMIRERHPDGVTVKLAGGTYITRL